jgi:hypothetical protein
MIGFIYSHKRLIGTTDFKHSFGSMGHIYGDFTPTDEYESIKKEVQEFCTATKRDYEKWYSLRFNVQIENGYFIFPIGGYEIFDFPDFPNEPMEFHIAGIDFHIYEDYFENSKQFLIAPWEKLSIEQKIDLEDELFREIGETNTSFSALAKHGFKDDVLLSRAIRLLAKTSK